ncbi:MAG: protein phosphatase 2C domain-containing protein [Ruminococcus sp.]|nr:protein phosphatase 2C domain-containing protein [Ruminococcus sp.]
MNNETYSAICFSHIGSRTNHEDNFLINGTYLTSETQKQMSDNRCYSFKDSTTSKVCLYAVSDGMGGHNAGEVASRFCVAKLSSVFEELQRCSSIRDVVAYLQTVIAEINETVYDLSRKHDDLKGMGATLVLFVSCEKECAVLNIGDSRAYYYANDKLFQITKDNTEGQRMLDLGLLTRKELSEFPARKNLSRYIGFNQSGYVLQADEYYPTIDDGVVILCSDGISDFVSDARIAEILDLEKNLDVAGKQLINEAVAYQNADNTTVMLIPLRR